MAGTRHVRVEQTIMEEVADIIKTLKDPGVGFASVLRVEASSDYSVAKVHMSVLGSEEEKRRSRYALKRAKGHIRSELGKRIRLRHTPELVFLFSGEMEHAARIQEILAEIHREDDPSAEDH